MSNLRRFKNNKLTLLFGGTIATIILLIIIKAWLNARDEGITFKETVGELFSREQTTVTEFPKAKEPPKLTVVEAKRKLHQTVLNSRGISRGALNYKLHQQKILKDFQETIHLKLNFPPHLHYITLDFEDDVGVVYGRSIDGKESFAVLATSRKVTVNQVLGYLQETSASLPMLKGHRFQPDKAMNYTPSSSTGLGAVTIIPSTDVNGKGLYAVFAPRADEKGNYLFMMEAEKKYFDANEEGLEKMLQEMKAVP